ncbi:hypothetical protein C7B76_24095 [filamentous cyanobacterium CCP2]|nr:hypothetical protein C7B76_24095 [filamentous cyanobacterium CCP2]
MGLLKKQFARWQSNIQPNTKDLPLSRGNDKLNLATPDGVKFSHVAGAIGFFQVFGQKVFFILPLRYISQLHLWFIHVFLKQCY